MHRTLKVCGPIMHGAPLLNKMHLSDKDHEEDEGGSTLASLDTLVKTLNAIKEERYVPTCLRLTRRRTPKITVHLGKRRLARLTASWKGDILI